MTTKLSTILELNNTLKSIIDNTDIKIDHLLKFKLLGVAKSIETPIINFEIIKNDKIREYGQEDKDGNISISKEDTETIEKFTKDLDTILNSDVDVNIQKLKPTDIFDKGLPIEYLLRLYSIIEE